MDLTAKAIYELNISKNAEMRVESDHSFQIILGLLGIAVSMGETHLK